MNLPKSLKLPLYFTSVSPVLIVWSYSGFRDYWLFLLLLGVVVFMQAALNLSMDYFDHLNGRNLRNEDTLFPIGSYLIEKEGADPARVRIAFVLCALVSVGFGAAIIVLTHVYTLLVVGVIALAVSFMYVLPPFRFNSRGFGEISTFLSFGPLSTIGSVLAFGDHIGFLISGVSVLLGMLASAIRYLHHLPEDRQDGTRVKAFRIVYPLILLPGFLVTLYRPLAFVFVILPFIVAIIHYVLLPRDVIPISRKTNQIVAIQVLTAVLLTIYFAIY